MQGSVNTNAAGLMSRREPPKITKIKRQLKSNKKDDISVVKWKDNEERNETGVAGWEEGWGFLQRDKCAEQP